MSEHKALSDNDKDFTRKSGLTQFKKIGGRVVEEDVSVGAESEDDFLDNLLGDGPKGAIDDLDLEEGREALEADPKYSSTATGEYDVYNSLNSAIDTEDVTASTMTATRIASTKRSGTLLDAEGDSLLFKRVGSNVALTEPTGEVIETVSSVEFNKLLDSNEYTVL